MLDAATIVNEEQSAMSKPRSKPSQTAISTVHDQVRIIDLSEYREAAACLADAFVEDEVVRYAIDTPDRAHWTEAEKYKLHSDALEYLTYAHCLKGMVTTVGPNYDAVALWLPPGKTMDDPLTILRSGMWRLNFRFSAQGRQRFFSEFLPLLHETKESVLGPRDPEAWYLVYIGTKKESRGRGYCRKLVQHVTQMADQEGRACYLESSNDINPIIYRKLGFETVKEIRLKEGNHSLDIMVREPTGSDE